MGDSYISGEVGRWQGNWNDPFGNRGGTDRAAYTMAGIWQYDASLVYGATAANGCHRSDVSEVLSSAIAVDALINLACSGAETQNIPRSSNGGNDLGFADIIITCTVEYSTSPSWWPNTCNGQEQAGVDSRMGAAVAAAGQADGYRLLLQSYPSPIPRASEFRYSESGWDRALVGGCPFLDLSDQLEDREVCSVHTSQGTGSDAEWARFLVTGLTQGYAQESMHPNAFGQQATGTCLRLLYAASEGDYACTNVSGASADTMLLSPG